jgi:hypothetical protein
VLTPFKEAQNFPILRKIKTDTSRPPEIVSPQFDPFFNENSTAGEHLSGLSEGCLY